MKKAATTSFASFTPQIRAYRAPEKTHHTEAKPNRSVALLMQRAQTQQNQGKLQAAGKTLQRAIRINPQNAILWHQLAEVHRTNAPGQQVLGFSLHAGVAAQAWERRKLERLCRYISRPAVSGKRLSLASSGNIRYKLKTPYNDGTTHVIFEPLDFIAKLAALVPKPRVNLTRFHGVFAPNSKHLVDVETFAPKPTQIK